MKTTALFFCMLVSTLGYSQYNAGDVFLGTNDYVSYHVGSLPLIISVPHGGLLDPSSIPDRDCTNCVTSNDTNTKELGAAIVEHIKALTGCDTHMIVNELRRRKMDANRDVGEAAVGNADAIKAWEEYHQFVEDAKVQLAADGWTRGLLIDLHGHGHTIQRLELGYRITSTDLRKTNSELDMIDRSDLPIRRALDSLMVELSEFVRGSTSMGALFDDRGYDAVPSPIDPAPQSGEPYFRGGYITDRYGSKDGSAIDAIQIECNQDVRFDEVERERFADSVAVVLLDFLKVHYYDDLESYCTTTSIDDRSMIEGLEIFPNPACTTLRLPDRSLQDVSIFNTMGQRLDVVIRHDVIDLSGLPQGLYTLLLREGTTYYKSQFVIHCR